MSQHKKQQDDQEAVLWRLLSERVDTMCQGLAGIATVLEDMGRGKDVNPHLHRVALDAHHATRMLRAALRDATPERTCRSCGGVFRPTRLLWQKCGTCLMQEQADDDLDAWEAAHL